MSSVRDDFEWLEEKPSVKITGAGGSLGKAGYVGKFKSNLFGITTAVFYEHLPVERLLAVRVLNQLGWTVIFRPSGDGECIRADGKFVPITFKECLPEVSMDEQDVESTSASSFYVEQDQFVQEHQCLTSCSCGPRMKNDSFETLTCPEVHEKTAGKALKALSSLNYNFSSTTSSSSSTRIGDAAPQPSNNSLQTNSFSSLQGGSATSTFPSCSTSTPSSSRPPTTSTPSASVGSGSSSSCRGYAYSSISEASGQKIWSFISKLEAHERRGHIWLPGEKKIPCAICDKVDGQKSSHRKARKPEYMQAKALRSLALDFKGKISPVSIRKCSFYLVVLDDTTRYVWVIPIASKDQVVEEVRNLITNIRAEFSVGVLQKDKVVYFLRSDNENVLRSDTFKRTLEELLVTPIRSVPYCPPQNGVVERFMRELSNGVRKMIQGVDARLHCYSAQYYAYLFNRLPHMNYRLEHGSGETPLQLIRQLTGGPCTHTERSERNFRRFGCLCYFLREPRGQIGSLEERWRAGVFVGISSSNSAWLVGTWCLDDRCAGGIRWDHFETRDVKFREKLLVADIDELRPGSPGVQAPFKVLEELRDSAAADGKFHSAAAKHHVRMINDLLPKSESTAPVETELVFEDEQQVVNEDRVDQAQDELIRGVCESRAAGVPPEGGQASSSSVSAGDKIQGSQPAVSKSPSDLPDPEVVQSEDELAAPVRRGRGRPKGSKDKNPRARRGRAKAPSRQKLSKGERKAIKKSVKIMNCILGLGSEQIDLEDGETIIESHVYLTAAAALKGPDRVHWQSAIDKEEAKILAFGTWRKLTDSEMQKEKQVLPVTIVLTKKRDGSFKARCCVLGNLAKPDGSIETYAPVISSGGNRYLLVEAAASGDFIEADDLDSAFLQATLEDEVYVSLPKCWQEKHKCTVVRLLKALYGLKQSPRAWYKKYEQVLRELGWTRCDNEHGLWRKASAKVPGRWLKRSVYVDDNLTSGPDREELRAETKAILDKLPGKSIPIATVVRDGLTWQSLDFLGADTFYSRERRSLIITMESFITKCAEKYQIKCTKANFSPGFNEKVLLDGQGKLVEKFPIREIVGSLQWVASSARPDIQVPVGVLARYQSKPVTSALVTAVKKVWKYLLSTKHMGIMYSPESEEQFRATYSKLLPPGRVLPARNEFSDAGFANTACFRSTSGSVLYYRGTPIIWKSQKQGVRAYSTAESEYIAASDTIVVSEMNNYMDFFKPLPERVAEENFGQLVDDDDAILWVDNTSAIATATSTEVKPKSRHYALRYHRVKEQCGRIVYCPTTLMKADGLTKLVCAVQQRNLLLHNTDIVTPNDVESDSESEDDEPDSVAIVDAKIAQCFLSLYQ